MISNVQNLLAGGESSTHLYNPILNSTLNSNAVVIPAWFFSKLIPNAIGLLFVIGVIVFFFMLVMGAIAWISSGGDKNALESARGKISNALIGLVILFSVYAIIFVIQNFFGINILTLDISSLIIQ